MDASDAQFQAFVLASGIPVDDDGIAEWSFDDRCRVINHALKYGLSLPFVEEGSLRKTNKNNSEPEQNQFVNNSKTIQETELFDEGERSMQATSNDTEEVDTQGLTKQIDSLLTEIEKSSDSEQKEQ